MGSHLWLTCASSHSGAAHRKAIWNKDKLKKKRLEKKKQHWVTHIYKHTRGFIRTRPVSAVFHQHCQQGDTGCRKQDEFPSASFHHTAMTPLFTSPSISSLAVCHLVLSACAARLSWVAASLCACMSLGLYQHICSDGVSRGGHRVVAFCRWGCSS